MKTRLLAQPTSVVACGASSSLVSVSGGVTMATSGGVTMATSGGASLADNGRYSPSDMLTSHAITFRDPDTGVTYVQTQLLQVGSRGQIGKSSYSQIYREVHLSAVLNLGTARLLSKTFNEQG